MKQAGSRIVVIVLAMMAGGCEEWVAEPDEEDTLHPVQHPPPKHEPPEPPKPDSCEYANDGDCDETTTSLSLCPIGTDTSDCSLPNSCWTAHNGFCDEGTLCKLGTDTYDCTPEIPDPTEPPEELAPPGLLNTNAAECLAVTQRYGYGERDTFDNICDHPIVVMYCYLDRGETPEAAWTNIDYVLCNENHCSSGNDGNCVVATAGGNPYDSSEQPYYTYGLDLPANYVWESDEFGNGPSQPYNYAVCKGTAEDYGFIYTQYRLWTSDDYKHLFVSDDHGNYNCYQETEQVE